MCDMETKQVIAIAGINWEATYYYALCDRENSVIRYVGQSTGDVAYRVRQHFNSDNKVGRWLRKSVRSGKNPRVGILSIYLRASRSHWTAVSFETEYAWIRHAHLRQRGRLLNSATMPNEPKPSRSGRWRCEEPEIPIDWMKLLARYDSPEATERRLKRTEA